MAPNLRSTLRSTIATSSSHMTHGTGGIEAKRAGVLGHHAKYDYYVLQELSEELGSGSESGLPEGGSRRSSFKLSPRSMARRYSQLKEVGVESFMCMYVCMYVCMHVCMCVCVCVLLREIVSESL
jgi:hypothetical protein